MSEHNNYGIKSYGSRVSVTATCDEGHTYAYTLYATENSKMADCLKPSCDAKAWPSR